MKRYLVLLCLALPLLGHAQSLKQQDILGKGHFNAGVSVGQGYRGTYPTTTFTSPHIQYFITNGWSLAIEGRYVSSNIYPQSVDKPDYRLWSGGVSTRYYFLRGKRLATFVHLGTYHGQSTLRMKSDAPATESRAWQTEVGLGAHYRVAKRWSVEAMVGRSGLKSTPTNSYFLLTPDDFNRWQVSIGINYQLR
ncbi:outer membrane beta-barrel protein [Spirosoma aerolatum]|uniref:outer membrane beta-barrel protein n=1 Tax=Spirosoma aerolatum TaxID=1211326 RepID=UPI0009AE07CA|nr:outer membrane beta-barrel protein [Spirosoma aerolatum]